MKHAAEFILLLALGYPIALASIKLAYRTGPAEEAAVRFASLDGLRGFAALAVYFHHASAWYSFAIRGEWAHQTRLAGLLGPTAVSLFFMVTAFLFVDKVVFGKRPADWLRLYVGRALRMLPLFLFVFVLVLVIVTAKSSGLNEPWGDLLTHIAQWLPLTLFGAPDINRFPSIWMLVAGATWTLPYECLFYLTLPAIALLRRPALSIALVVASAAFFALLRTSTLVVFAPWGTLAYCTSFASGAVAALLIQSPRWRRMASGRVATALSVATLALAFYMPIGHSWLSAILLQAIFFALVSGGNTLGGVLTWPSSRQLGHLSYSVYLLHGLLLYLVVKELIGLEKVSTWGPATYWGLVLLLIPVLLLVSHATYRLIELPWLQKADRWTSWLRTRFASAPAKRAA